MYLEHLRFSNFRCFGEVPTSISLDEGLSIFVGANGTGKTAVLQALQRLFGVTADQRRIRRQDFHVPARERDTPSTRSLWIEVVVAFPELEEDDGDSYAIPEFFHQMAADAEGNLRCRLRLEATWTDDGSLDGAVEQKVMAVRTLGEFEDADCIDLKPLDRARIQFVYVPAMRDGQSQVSAFLRGRLWRAVNWSEDMRDALDAFGGELNEAFGAETAVSKVTEALRRRWQDVHGAGTYATPVFRPVNIWLEDFIRNAGILFQPDEIGQERAVEDLSDGQRSLFHFAMTAATLDIEDGILRDPEILGFQPDAVPLPSLTLIGIEEPENNLAPFYLSRITKQILDLTAGPRAQAIVSSHSASILARVDPGHIRHFRLDAGTRTAMVNNIRLPEDEEEAAKFVREAVRSYPELYFARLVVLGEGASEEIVLPRLAEALKMDVDRSFVAVVPLGGRHVNHLWKLLADLDVPHLTLLDLDWGRAGGGWGRIKTVCAQLHASGRLPAGFFGDDLPADGLAASIEALGERANRNFAELEECVEKLRELGVFFCAPLDLDYSMLRAFPTAYQIAEAGRRGPSLEGDPRGAVLGEGGKPGLYDSDHDETFRWYRYLFLGRGKPATHLRVLSSLSLEDTAELIPDDLRKLLAEIQERVSGEEEGVAPGVPEA